MLFNDPMAKILLVDDDDVDVMTVRRAFRKVGLTHTIDVASDGLEALEYLRSCERLPDYVLLDVNMPRMGGLEFLKEVRADPKLHSLSVIMLTTSKADRDVMNAYDLNVSSYIVKPVDYHKFVEAVEILDKFWSINQRPDVA